MYFLRVSCDLVGYCLCVCVFGCVLFGGRGLWGNILIICIKHVKQNYPMNNFIWFTKYRVVSAVQNHYTVNKRLTGKVCSGLRAVSVQVSVQFLHWELFPVVKHTSHLLR